MPYQPAGLWEERSNEGSNTKSYKRSDGESLYRRSLYTFWKRTCPPPVMTVFDAPDRLNCTAPRTSPYAGQRHVRFGRRAVAHLGRFLPRLGPFASPSGPFFVARLCSPETSAAVAYSHSYAQPNFCNAKRFACILCAAHLHTQREAGDPVAGFVALLGRFLPRLGPHGLPRGPFYLLMPASS